MAGAWTRKLRVACQSLDLFRIHRVWVHDLFPFRPFGVGDVNGHRRAEWHTVADSTNDRDLVFFELHSCPAPVAEATTLQGILNIGGCDLNTCGKSFNDPDKPRPVRFSCC